MLTSERAKELKAKQKRGKGKVTLAKVRDMVEIISKLENTLEEDIEKLTPSERAKMWAMLREFTDAKLSRTETIDKTDRKVTIEFVEVTGESPNTLPKATFSTSGDNSDSATV